MCSVQIYFVHMMSYSLAQNSWTSNITGLAREEASHRLPLHEGHVIVVKVHMPQLIKFLARARQTSLCG
jgi:hypothetical protein